MKNVAMQSCYQMITESDMTHLFNTANADSRNPKVWSKMPTGLNTPAHQSMALRGLSGSPNALVPGGW